MPGMTEYAIGFARRLAGQTTKKTRLVLIQRTKDDWQKGFVNLPGGHVEEGESPVDAACREVEEETGLICIPQMSFKVGEIIVHDALIHVVVCKYPSLVKGKGLQKPVTKAPEEGNIIQLRWDEIKNRKELMPQLRIIMPLCMTETVGWTLHLDHATDDEFRLELAAHDAYRSGQTASRF